MDLVLEDGAADGDTEGLAEGAEERVHADGPGEVGGSGGGLDCEGEAGEEGAFGKRERVSGNGRDDGYREIGERQGMGEERGGKVVI